MKDGGKEVRGEEGRREGGEEGGGKREEDMKG